MLVRRRIGVFLCCRLAAENEEKGWLMYIVSTFVSPRKVDKNILWWFQPSLKKEQVLNAKICSSMTFSPCWLIWYGLMGLPIPGQVDNVQQSQGYPVRSWIPTSFSWQVSGIITTVKAMSIAVSYESQGWYKTRQPVALLMNARRSPVPKKMSII